MSPKRESDGFLIMSFKKFLSYFIPFTTKYKSDVNGTLEVTLYNGKKVLDTANANFSYGSVHRVFKTSFSKVDLKNTKNVLLLGLGAGSVIDLLRNDFQYKEKISAIELDQKVIEIAKSEFNLESFGQLRIIEGDAFLEIHKLKENFDLIIVDLFIDNTIPDQLYELSFWKEIIRISSRESCVIFNTIVKTTGNLEPVLNIFKTENFQEDFFTSEDNINWLYIWRR